MCPLWTFFPDFSLALQDQMAWLLKSENMAPVISCYFSSGLVQQDRREPDDISLTKQEVNRWESPLVCILMYQKKGLYRGVLDLVKTLFRDGSSRPQTGTHNVN